MGGVFVLAGDRCEAAPAHQPTAEGNHTRAVQRNRQTRATAPCVSGLVVATDRQRTPHRLQSRRCATLDRAGALPLLTSATVALGGIRETLERGCAVVDVASASRLVFQLIYDNLRRTWFFV